jgi:predicted DNA-binding protein with PD1-like motif
VLLAESHRGRRLVGRLSDRAELVAALLGACRGHGVRSGEVRALGMLESLTLAPGRTLAGPLEILTLYGQVVERGGTLTLAVSITVARSTELGVQVAGGHIEAATVKWVDFVVEAFDDLVLRHDQGGLCELVPLGATPPAAPAVAAPVAVPTVAAQPAPQPPRPAPVAPPAQVAPPAPPVPSSMPTPLPRFESSSAMTASQPSSASWADVVKASRRVEEPNDDSLHIETGDIIQHPVLGRCVVERIEGEHEFATVRRDTGRLVRLSLEVLRFRQTGTEGTRRLFRVQT